MTLIEFVLALVGSNAATALVASWLQRGKSKAETRKLEQDAEHTAVDTANDLTGMIKAVYEARVLALEVKLETETTRANENEQKVDELKQSLTATSQAQSDTLARLAGTEGRLAQSEARAADAEKRATEFRQDIIKVGTQIQEYRRLINELGEILGGLMGQLEKLGVKPDVSPETLKRIADVNSAFAYRPDAR